MLNYHRGRFMSEESQPPEGPPSAPAQGVLCSGCGWANPKGVATCEFCRMPLSGPPKEPRQRPPAPAPAPVVAPAVPASLQPAVETDKTLAERVRQAITPLRAGLAGTLVVMGVVSFLLVRRGPEGVTERKIAVLKRLVVKYESETGGYPPDFAAPQNRFGKLGPGQDLDGWGRRILFIAKKPRIASALGRAEDGTPLFGACEIRSAGRNGIPGDVDDIVWTSD